MKSNQKKKIGDSRKRSRAISDKADASLTDEAPKSKKKKSAVTEHKETLEQLRETDPSFYEFLKAQDAELLDFDESDAEEDGGDSDGQVINENGEDEEVEEPDIENEEEDDEGIDASSNEEQDEIDPEGEQEDETVSKKVPVTPKMARQWEKELFGILKNSNKSGSKSVSSILNQIIDAFRAVVTQAGAKPDKRSRFRIDDSTGFNAVVRLCFSVFPKVWKKISGADYSKLSQARRAKLRPYVKPYLQNLTAFLQEIQNDEALNAVLRHLTHVADYYSLFGTVSRRIVQALISIWSTKQESARILAFISIAKLVRGNPETLSTLVIKKMYLSYVKNTKLVTASTWPLINFMQRSYAEICGLDKQLTYQHSFIYIRQLAIHLRNAITTKKLEQISAVYNWQFVQCLYLWARVLSTHGKDGVLKPLVYPLIQIAMGCARLVPTAKYFPLRFHCVRAILILAQESDVYVPVLPIILEVFNAAELKKKHQRQSLKPFDFDCLLKLSQSQIQESGFKIGVVEAALELILETMNACAGSVAFPELAFVCCNGLKSFYKSTRIAALARPVKELTDKINEHASWLERHRTETALNLTNANNHIKAFETRMILRNDAPLGKYFETFKIMKERERKLKMETAIDQPQEDVMDEDEEVIAPSKKKQKKEKSKKALKKVKKESANKKTIFKDEEDVVQDLNLSDLDE